LKKFLKYLFLFFLSIGTLLGIYASFIEPFRLVVTEYTVKTDKWRANKPLKIVVLTDAHVVSPWMTEAHLNRIVDKANLLNPDIVLLLGDYVATHPFGFKVKPDEGLRPYKNLKAVCGVFAVLGNHDFQADAGWPEAMMRTGIPTLRNEIQKITCDGRSFSVAGLDELWWGHPDISKIMTAADKKLPIIMMMHNPDLFPETPKNIALNVAGHTHGGQVLIPFIGPVAAAIPSHFGTRYARGHIQENGKDLVVSSGLGMSVLPIRFMCPPEITVVTLEKLD
jgi:predicted MPP superfamily phosphohydrolase